MRTSSSGRPLDDLVVPAARELPSPSEYLAHLDLAPSETTMIRLATNENSGPPSPRVRAALAAAYDSVHRYAPTTPSLRTALAERHGVSATSVLLGAGSTEVIDATLRAFVRAGDEVVVPTPCWPVLRARLAALGARLVAVPLVDDGDSFMFDVDALLAAVTPRTKVLVVGTPNNPTGNSLAPDELRRLADAGPLLLVDGAYVDFDLENDPTPLARESDRAVVTRTFSKAYALAGLRVGYALGDPELLDYVARLLVPGSSIGVTGLAAGLAALEDDEHVRTQIRRVRSERERLVPALRRLGLRTFSSRGNFLATEPASLGRTPAELAALLRGRGILVRPMDDRILRITVGAPRENDAVLAALASLA